MGCGLPDINPMKPGKEPPGFNSVLVHSFRFKSPIDYASRLVIKNAFRMLGQKLFEGKYQKVEHRDKQKARAAHPIRFHVTKTHVHCAYYYNAKVIDEEGYHGELETSFSTLAENCLDAFRQNLPLWYRHLEKYDWYSKDIHENLACAFHHFARAYDTFLSAPNESHTFTPTTVITPKRKKKFPLQFQEHEDNYEFRAKSIRHKFRVPFAISELTDPNNCHMISIFGVIFDDNWKWYDNDFQFLIDWQDYIPYFSNLKYEKITVLPLSGAMHGSIALHIPEPYHDFFQKTSILGRFVLSEKQMRQIKGGGGSGASSSEDSDTI